MKKFLLFVLGGLLVLAPKAQAATLTLETFASSAPNIFGSPSWAGYLSNALTGIDNGGVATGTPGDPTYYQSGVSFLPGDLKAP